MTISNKLACIILAAGKGTRMKSALPKPLHEIAGRSMVGHVIATCEALNPEKIVVVIGADMLQMADAVKPHATAIQAVANGTGGAARAARDHFKNFDGDILVVFSDTPLVTAETMQRLVEARRQLPAIGLTYSAFRPADPA
ncbi:MAG TPA: NTP transferase domain-containing protein, partial [Patescibacteria group bacterium]|nr:NTP transferase domain-containing protein [Patescibacteria group bacterium]